MALKFFEIDFKDFASKHYFYASYKFHYFNKELKKEKNLKDNILSYFNVFTGFAFKSEDYLDNGVKLLRIGDFSDLGDVDYRKMVKLPEKYIEKYKKFLLKDNDIVIALTGATIGKSAIIMDLKDNVLLNQRVGLLRAKTHNINVKFYYYLTKSKSFRFQIQINAMGKGQQNISPTDVSKIKIPKIPKHIQDQAVARIEPIEQEIKQLKSQIKQPQEIINKVFAREFGFDENLYNKFGKGMTAGTQIAQNRKLRVFETEFKELSRSSIFRFSTRFHNPPTKELMDFMDKIKTLKVKDIINEAIHRGANPKYDQNGEIPVVKTGHLKNGYIEISEEEFVSEEFYNQKERSQVKENDVLLASTGKVSLGKIDLVETDEKLVVDGHISIIRIDKNKYNPLFFTYFFRSILGFFQIERDYTGATNQIELYANEIENFLIPDISLTEQKRIVNEIKSELDKQEEIKKKIENLRKKIDKIIETAITQ